jgi:mevalonate kinase
MKPGFTYPSKIMLVGEYGVVLGGAALSIPFPRFRATIRSMDEVAEGKEEECRKSAGYLQRLHAYISTLSQDQFHARPDLGLFEEQLDRVWMEMDIPVGCGLGSSGVVSAAIYDSFFPGSRDLDLLRQKEDLAVIESFFHGKSSGVDALTCFTARPLYFMESGAIREVDFQTGHVPGGYQFFLLDSDERKDTGPLVASFMESMRDPGYARAVREEYLPLNRQLIETLLGERQADPAMLLGLLSDFQFRYFRPMIPEHMHDTWIQGQIVQEYYLKLNGSGGGFLLGIAHHSQKEILDERWREKLIWID